jgi:hypothetical protein
VTIPFCRRIYTDIQVIRFRFLRFPNADGLDYSFKVWQEFGSCGNANCLPRQGKVEIQSIADIVFRLRAEEAVPFWKGRHLCNDPAGCPELLSHSHGSFPKSYSPFMELQNSLILLQRKGNRYSVRFSIRMSQPRLHGPLYEILLVFFDRGRKHSKHVTRSTHSHILSATSYFQDVLKTDTIPCNLCLLQKTLSVRYCTPRILNDTHDGILAILQSVISRRRDEASANRKQTYKSPPFSCHVSEMNLNTQRPRSGHSYVINFCCIRNVS